MKDEALRLALKLAFRMGQDYWYHADHEFSSYHKKADAIRAEFDQLVEKTIKQGLANDALDRMAENERELGIQMQPEPEPVIFYRCKGCDTAYEDAHPTSCDCMEDKGFERIEYYTSPPRAEGDVPKRKPLTWQPIETAPKETEVLVYGDGATHVARLVKNGWAIDDGGGLAYINTPAHWMHLPKPPVEAAHGFKGGA